VATDRPSDSEIPIRCFNSEASELRFDDIVLTFFESMGGKDRDVLELKIWLLCRRPDAIRKTFVAKRGQTCFGKRP
jgi:hypothetical protein